MEYTSISKLDIFGDGIPITFKNDIRYKTLVGGLLTILFIIISFILTVVVLVRYFYRKPYSVIAYEESNFYVSIDISNAPLLFSVYNDLGEPIELDERLFYFKATNYIREVKNINGNKVINQYENDLKIVNCATMKEENPDFLSQFNDHNLANYMCIVPGQNLFLNGTRGEIRYNYSGLRLYVKRCNSELRTDCYTKEVAYEKSKDKRVFFTFVSPQFDFKETNLNSVDEVYTVINTIPLVDTLYYYYRVAKTVIRYNDGGIDLFNTYTNKTTFKISDYNSEQVSYPDEKMYGYLEFSSTGRINNIYRNQENFFNYIGIISGLINAIFILLRCVVFLYYDKFMFLDVLNSFIRNGLNCDKNNSFQSSYNKEQISKSNILKFNKQDHKFLNLVKNYQNEDSNHNQRNISSIINKNHSLSKIYQNFKDSDPLRQKRLFSLNCNIIENKKRIATNLNNQIKRSNQRFWQFILCPIYFQQKLDYFALESSIIKTYSNIINVINFWETHFFIDSFFDSNYFNCDYLESNCNFFRRKSYLLNE